MIVTLGGATAALNAFDTSTLVANVSVGSLDVGTFSVTVSIVDASGRALKRVLVDFAISRNGALYASWHAKKTSSSGRVSVTITHPSGGCYATSVTALSAAGWDGATPQNQLCR